MSAAPLPRLHVISDLHLDSGPYEIPPGVKYDVLVAAGDIAPVETAVPWLARQGKPVVYVLGNHERYGGDLDGQVAAARQLAEGTQVHVLERDAVTIQGVRFLGCTLWSDLRKLHRDSVSSAWRMMRDYRSITCKHWLQKSTNAARLTKLCTRRRLSGELEKTAEGEPLLHPGVTYLEYRESARWLQKQLAIPHDGPTVVVSHHAPSYESLLRSGFRPEELAATRWSYNAPEPARIAAYASDGLLDAVDGSLIDLWVHGHIHAAMDYLQNGVRVLCNARGRHVQPFTPDEVRAFALLGYPTTPEEVQRSEDASRRNPYRGEVADFEPTLVVDLERGLEGPLRRACERPLEELRELQAALEELLPYTALGTTVVDRCVTESYEARIERQRSIRQNLGRDIVSQVDRYWDRPFLSRADVLTDIKLFPMNAVAVLETREEFETVLSYHTGVCAWVEALPTLVTASLRELRDAIARLMRAAATQGYELRLKRLPPAVLRTVMSQPLVFVVTRAPAGEDAEAVKARLNLDIDRELNGSKTPRRWTFFVSGDGSGQALLGIEQMYRQGDRDGVATSRENNS